MSYFFVFYPLMNLGYHKSGNSFIKKKLFEAFPELFYQEKQPPIKDYFVEPTPLHF